MERNRAILHTISTETPGDAELSRQLGRYQKQARTWLRVGLISIAGGVISFFTVHHTALKAILVTVLFFGGICCVLFLNGSAQKKIKRLIAFLLEMGRVLDLLLKNTALFAGPE